MKADAVVIGDSHAIAVSDALRDMGYRAEVFFASGGLWNKPRIRFHSKLGLACPANPAITQRVRDLAGRLDQPGIFARDVPVIASVGFHLNVLSAQLRAFRLTDDPDGEGTAMSRAFFDA